MRLIHWDRKAWKVTLFNHITIQRISSGITKILKKFKIFRVFMAQLPCLASLVSCPRRIKKATSAYTFSFGQTFFIAALLAMQYKKGLVYPLSASLSLSRILFCVFFSFFPFPFVPYDLVRNWKFYSGIELFNRFC